MNLAGATSAELRAHFLSWWFEPVAAVILARVPEATAVVLAVSQCWNDEADDAVHAGVYPMRGDALVWPVPGVDDRGDDGDGDDPMRVFLASDAWDDLHQELWQLRCFNGGNYDLIVAFAAYCRPGSTQDTPAAESYTPYAIRWRDREPAVEVVGVVQQPQWEDRFDRPERAGGVPLPPHSPHRTRAIAGQAIAVDELLAAAAAPDQLAAGVAVARALLTALEAEIVDADEIERARRDAAGWATQARGP